jgi:hypothetical protein
MKEQFIEKRFNYHTMRIIENANYIINEYKAKGYARLTLRQLYYQFVARDLVANEERVYKQISSAINDGRLAGLIDWSAIHDRTRNLMSAQNYSGPSAFMALQAEQYAEELWKDQPYYCEVWVEKDALVGVIEEPCDRLRVPFFACRGYMSQSEAYAGGKRLAQKLRQGKKIVIFHLGDHDPSGIDMTRDNDERLSLFAGAEPGEIEVRRLALNYDQIVEFNPPPNPAKLTDTRAKDYIKNYGDSSWELDSLDPLVLDKLVSTSIESIIDKPKMTAAAEKERLVQEGLRLIAKHYPEAVAGAALKRAADELNQK